MISPKFFIESLKNNGIEFFAGVPDSLLKNICAYITDTIDDKHNIIAANEGAAIGVASGYYLATGKPGVVYMQNSGQGNIINPLASLTDKEVYDIPMLLLIGWRGRPGVHDEPQHVKQGKITTGLLNVMGVDYDILSTDEDIAEKQIANAIKALNNNEIYALVIEKGTFEDYKLKNIICDSLSLGREDAIGIVTASTSYKDVVISTTGMISRELFEYRENHSEGHEKDFLTVGSMGHASQVALGIALESTDRRVWCFDGDGASIMHMGSMAIVAQNAPENYVHIVFNNGAHDSVGGQPTVGLKVNLSEIAKAVGYKKVYTADDREQLICILKDIKNVSGPIFIEIKVKKGSRKDLGRPTITPKQNKEALMDFLRR
ncbi:MAG: phosphonopyruvate decarboxylase [Candidatus Cryptobacteroides sp.]